MDFLLECIGFPPDLDHEALVEQVVQEGDPAPWRGDPRMHRTLALGAGLEVRLDKEEGKDFWTLLPHYRSPHRLRVGIETLNHVPDSPFDALLTGWACPPNPGDPGPLLQPGEPGAYRLTTWLVDAQRIPSQMPTNHVLAVSIAGFALQVDYVGPDEGVCDPSILERRRGAAVAPVGTPDAPGGCSEVSLRVQSIQHLRNPLTGQAVDLLVTDAPERPLLLFVNPWQLKEHGQPPPRPGWRIEGTFLFSGTVAGGIPVKRRRTAAAFG